MSTVACLRISVGKDLSAADADALAGVVAKVTGAFLETTWPWPRRFGLVAPFAFVLADPRATRLDVRELQTLAANLQAKLFGTKGLGEVCLLTLEGDQTEVMRFAGAHQDELRALLEGIDDGAFAGRICKITSDGAVSVAPENGPVDGAPSAEELKAMPVPAERAPPGVGWRGIYRLAAEVFAGAYMTNQAEGRGEARRDTDDPFALERDLAGLRTVCEAAPTVRSGVLYVGFGYSSLVRPSARAALKPSLEALPANLRPRLGAMLRQAPREPSYGSLAEILRLLSPHFCMLNLQVSDPEFRIDCIPAERVRTVTLALSGSDERMRLKAIRRFLAGQPAYEANRVWQGVANLRSAAELDLCRQMNARFVSGSAVSELSRAPLGDLAVPFAHLPYGSARRRSPRRMEPVVFEDQPIDV